MNYSKILFEYRKKRKITQIELAEILIVSQAYISQIEAGQREPSRRLMEKMEYAGVLDVCSGRIDVGIAKILANELLLVLNRYRKRSVKNSEILAGIETAKNKYIEVEND